MYPDLPAQVRKALADDTIIEMQRDVADITEYASRLRSSSMRLFDVPRDSRQEPIIALVVDFKELRARLLRLFADLALLQRLGATPVPFVRPDTGLDEGPLDADLVHKFYAMIAHGRALGAAPACRDAFLERLDDVVKYSTAVDHRLPVARN